MKINVETVGNEGNKIVVIDDVCPYPNDLRELATSMAPYEMQGAENYYPGIRRNFSLNDKIAMSYIDNLMKHIEGPLCEIFGYSKFRVHKGSFSLVTLKPDELSQIQRMPHFDFVETNRFAILHYLAHSSSGGTAFYRHKSTGFEYISAERKQKYISTVTDEIKSYPLEESYINKSSALFDQTAAFDDNFNRILVYKSGVLHSGNISPDANLSADPKIGRLTTNLFAEAT